MARLFRKSFLSQLLQPKQVLISMPERSAPLFWPFCLALSGLMGSLIIWSIVSTVNIAIVASGIMLPLGGVRDIQSLSSGIVTARLVTGGNTVKAGQVLAHIHEPGLEDAYARAREHYSLKYREISLKRKASNERLQRAVAYHQAQDEALSRAIEFLVSIRGQFKLNLETFFNQQERSLKLQKSSIEKIRQTYAEHLRNMEGLQKKRVIDKSTLIKHTSRFDEILGKTSRVSKDFNQLNIDHNSKHIELGEIEEKIEKYTLKRLDNDNTLKEAKDDFRSREVKLEIKKLEICQKLLESEKKLWRNQNILSPYDGKLISFRPAIGHIVKTGETIALFEMKTQSSKKTLFLSPRIHQGTLCLRYKEKSRPFALAPGQHPASQLKTLAKAIDSWLPEIAVTIGASPGSLVFEGDIAPLRLTERSLYDEDHFPVFADLITVGDNWQQSQLLNMAIVQSRQIRRIEVGSKVLIKPDYERSLLGAQVSGEVMEVGEYSVTRLEIEALIGSSELAETVSSGQYGYLVLSRLLQDNAGNHLWIGGQPSRELKAATKTSSQFIVGKERPFNLIVPFIHDIFTGKLFARLNQKTTTTSGAR